MNKRITTEYRIAPIAAFLTSIMTMILIANVFAPSLPMIEHCRIQTNQDMTDWQKNNCY